ncbi:MAG: redoxin domain-containing protein [Caldithrix sp.]|nr:redoxin domain-containing protein [Caldithrix sp.]
MRIDHNKLIYAWLSLFLWMMTTGFVAGREFKTAENFALQSIDGEVIRLSDYRGKYVIVNFWATWCGPCYKEMPELEKIHKKYSGGDVQVIGIALVSKPDEIPGVVKRTGVTYPILKGHKTLIKDFGYFSSIPHTFIINPQGKIVKEYNIRTNAAQLEKTLLDLMKN